jgi:hypothetical protein
MTAEKTPLDKIIDDVAPQLPPVEKADDALPGMRDLFLELTTLGLGSLYSKTPLPAQLYDRATLKVVTAGIDDTDASKLTLRSEDGLRLEGVVRAAEGQKAYNLNRPSMAVLSTPTALGSLGDVMERIQRAYAEGKATPELRIAARRLAAYFLTRIARS